MPTVHMIHGFVGAGKTTFAKKLESEVKAVRFSPDEWMCGFYGNNPPAERFGEYYQNIEVMIRKVAEKIIVSGVDVILDYGFWKKAERDETRQWAQGLGAGIKLYNLQCSENTMKARTLKRTADMPDGALVIDENALNLFCAQFEPVDPKSEDCLTITTG